MPIFHMSLSSKELFHSNFIGWILESYPNKMAQFFIKGTSHSIKNVKREKSNIDLSFEINDTLFIIENKIKSIAYKEQLNKYSGYDFIQEKETNIRCILLSLKESTLFNKNEYIAKSEEIHNEHINKNITKDITWSYLSYISLIEYLGKIDFCNFYHKSLVIDYCNFIRILDDCIVKKLAEVNIVKLYIKDTPESKTLNILRELKMHDFFQKGIFENFAHSLQAKIEDKFITNGKVIGNNEINIQSGMSRSIGLIDIKLKYNESIIIGIQIQGNQYRKLIEGAKEEEVVALALKLENEKYFDEMLPSKPNPNLNKYNEHLAFNKFVNPKGLFLYKYNLLEITLSNDELIDKIKNDINIILELKK